MRDGRFLPRAAGLAGTMGQLVVGALRQGGRLYSPPSWFGGVSSAISVVAFTLAVYGLLYLSRSLSIIPEVRRLVTGGPYRVVRHPLYAAEILAADLSALGTTVECTVSTIVTDPWTLHVNSPEEL